MHAGTNTVRATFWLLDAPVSLEDQSRLQPDGTGIGTFAPDGTPDVEKRPVAAFEDELFAAEAREVQSRTFIAHVRYASTGSLRFRNTHPFEQEQRLFAHNGVLEGLPALEAELGNCCELVHGDTDSERLFALITKRTHESGGDVGAGIISAVEWVAANLPVYALNLIITTVDELWALRYPERHGLYVLERPAGGQTGAHVLEVAGSGGTVHVRSNEMRDGPVVVVASEPMDGNPGWELLRSGELLHVARDLTVTRMLALPDAPLHLLTDDDLDETAAASQHVAGV